MIFQKECAQCGRVFHKDRRYSQAQFDEQSYCSKHCYSQACHAKPFLTQIFNRIAVKLTYKAGWSQEYVVFGVYNTRKEACEAARQIPRKPKIWGIKVEEVK